MSKFIKFTALIFALTLSSIALTSCTDYGYEFHFAVIQGNGHLTFSHPTIDIENLDVKLCSEAHTDVLNCPVDSHVFYILGGKNNSYEFTFIAEPNEGYQVKLWSFNNEIVPFNKTISFLAKVSSSTSYQGFISVEFEKIA